MDDTKLISSVWVRKQYGGKSANKILDMLLRNEWFIIKWVIYFEINWILYLSWYLFTKLFRWNTLQFIIYWLNNIYSQEVYLRKWRMRITNSRLLALQCQCMKEKIKTLSDEVQDIHWLMRSNLEHSLLLEKTFTSCSWSTR